MPYFLSPRIIYGKGAMKRLAAEMAGKGDKAVLITDQHVASLATELLSTIKDSGYKVEVWDHVEPEPSTEVALRASRFLLNLEPQWIIGFGGGSAVDTAKAAWVLYERPDLASGDLGKAVLPKVRLDLRRKARMVAVPTTSGTGADVTWVAVLTDKAKGKKIIFAHNDIVPDLSVLDPALTLGLPKVLTASTGLDVLAHAVDGFTSRQQNDFSDGLCLQAMKMVLDWLPAACSEGNSLTARERMQNAATIAGLGFGNSNTGLSHALGHAAGALFHIPHGRAIGIALPYSLEYITSRPALPGVPSPVEKLALAARFVGIVAGPYVEATKAFIEKIRALQREVGEPLNLRDAGVREEDMRSQMDALVQLGLGDPNMYTTPCACEEKDLRELFQAMWSGRPDS